MTNAKTGWGGEFHFDNNSDVLTEWVEVVSFTLPNGETEKIDATHLKSPNRRREFISGMIDDGDITIVLNYVPGSQTDLDIMQAYTEGDTRDFMAVVPKATGEREYSGTGFISGVDRGEIAADSKMECTVTMTVVGSTSEADA